MKSWLARNIWPWSEIRRAWATADHCAEEAIKAEHQLGDCRLELLKASGEILDLEKRLATDANGNVKRGARGRFVSAKS